MLDHGGFAAEALQASIVAALVGALSGMNATVTGKTRRIGESLATANMLALVRLLARMCTDVDREGAPLNETLSTSSRRARVGTLVGVDSIMSLKVRLAVKALVT